ncbi:MAG: hypothetical protein ACHQT8_00740 [Chlamydiales bacterium]
MAGIAHLTQERQYAHFANQADKIAVHLRNNQTIQAERLFTDIFLPFAEDDLVTELVNKIGRAIFNGASGPEKAKALENMVKELKESADQLFSQTNPLSEWIVLPQPTLTPTSPKKESHPLATKRPMRPQTPYKDKSALSALLSEASRPIKKLTIASDGMLYDEEGEFNPATFNLKAFSQGLNTFRLNKSEQQQYESTRFQSIAAEENDPDYLLAVQLSLAEDDSKVPH